MKKEELIKGTKLLLPAEVISNNLADEYSSVWLEVGGIGVQIANVNRIKPEWVATKSADMESHRPNVYLSKQARDLIIEALKHYCFSKPYPDEEAPSIAVICYSLVYDLRSVDDEEKLNNEVK